MLIGKNGFEKNDLNNAAFYWISKVLNNAGYCCKFKLRIKNYSFVTFFIIRKSLYMSGFNLD